MLRWLAVRGAVIWITGLPGSGKTTLAERVRERLAQAVVLDGDVVRDLLALREYGPGGRDRFYDLLGRIAATLAAQGLIVLVAATAHERRFRERVREAVPRFYEVWVRTPRKECERRDPKRLYARARAGELRDVPGVDLEYERPEAPDVTASGGWDEHAIEAIVALAHRQYVAAPDPKPRPAPAR